MTSYDAHWYWLQQGQKRYDEWAKVIKSLESELPACPQPVHFHNWLPFPGTRPSQGCPWIKDGEQFMLNKSEFDTLEYGGFCTPRLQVDSRRRMEVAEECSTWRSTCQKSTSLDDLRDEDKVKGSSWKSRQDERTPNLAIYHSGRKSRKKGDSTARKESIYLPSLDYVFSLHSESICGNSRPSTFDASSELRLSLPYPSPASSVWSTPRVISHLLNIFF